MTLSKKPAPSPSSPSSPPLSKRTRMALGGTRRRDSDTSLCFKKEVELSYYDLEDMIHADPGYRYGGKGRGRVRGRVRVREGKGREEKKKRKKRERKEKERQRGFTRNSH